MSCVSKIFDIAEIIIFEPHTTDSGLYSRAPSLVCKAARLCDADVFRVCPYPFTDFCYDIGFVNKIFAVEQFLV